LLFLEKMKMTESEDFWYNEFKIIYFENNISGQAIVRFNLNKNWKYYDINKFQKWSKNDVRLRNY